MGDGRGSDEKEERARDGPSAAAQERGVVPFATPRRSGAWFLSPDTMSGALRMCNRRMVNG